MSIRDMFSDILETFVLPYAKAWAPVATLWVFGILAQFGLRVPEDVQLEVIGAVTTFLVWLVPNIPHAGK